MIVEALAPANDVESCLGPGFVSKLMDAFDFQRLEEALYRRIPAVGVAVHRLQHPETDNQLAVASAGVYLVNLVTSTKDASTDHWVCAFSSNSSLTQSAFADTMCLDTPARAN
jgi:hypothetical protein